MANLQHSTLPSSAAHEPKHITINGVAANGFVITNDGSTSGISQYRKLVQADIQQLQETWLVKETNASVAQTHYIPTVLSGEIKTFYAIVNDAIATASNMYELRIDGVAVTGSSITLSTAPGSGGTPGDIVSTAPSAANTFVAGQSLTIANTTLGNTDAGVDIRFALVIERT